MRYPMRKLYTICLTFALLCAVAYLVSFEKLMAAVGVKVPQSA
jgi:hypothetical protein